MSKSKQIEMIISRLDNRFTMNDLVSKADASSALINNVLKTMIMKGEIKKIGTGRQSKYQKIEGSDCTKEKEIIDIPVSERFEFIENFTRMVGKGVLPSMLLTGQAGVGKTYTVLETLDNAGLEEGEDYVIVKGHSSPMGLYKCLYFNNGKIVVFDDCDSVFSDVSSLNILKGALDSYSRRIISWQSLAAEKEGVPESFEFTGQIIFISNKDARRLDSAVVSRTVTCNLILTNEEIVDRMCDIKDEIEKDIPLKQKNEVLAFLKENADRFEGLSLRTFIQSLRIRVGCEDDKWKNMILWCLS